MALDGEEACKPSRDDEPPDATSWRCSREAAVIVAVRVTTGEC
jgi:hypothetical protein